MDVPRPYRKRHISDRYQCQRGTLAPPTCHVKTSGKTPFPAICSTCHVEPFYVPRENQRKPSKPSILSQSSTVCWTLSDLTQESSRKTIQDVVEANVCPRLVGLLVCTTSTAILPALLTLGDIAAESDSQIIINAGALPCLQFLLTQSADENILKSACWTISNIVAGTRAQVKAVIDAELIGPLVHLSNAEFDIRKEAARAIANATYFGTVEQIEYLVSKGCIKALCDLLTCTDPEVVAKCLKGLENILDTGELCKKRGLNSFAKMVSEIGGLETIVSLQSYGNKEICNSAVKILRRYWH